MACTSRSISSRLPELTTDLPSSCTSSISFSAFFFSYPKYFWKTYVT